jgi:hypothetical protein
MTTDGEALLSCVVTQRKTILSQNITRLYIVFLLPRCHCSKSGVNNSLCQHDIIVVTLKWGSAVPNFFQHHAFTLRVSYSPND